MLREPDTDHRRRVAEHLAAYQARLRTEHDRIAAELLAEGYRQVTVATWDNRARVAAILPIWRVHVGEPPGYIRQPVTGKSKPTWSRDWSVYNGPHRVALAKDDEPIFVKETP